MEPIGLYLHIPFCRGKCPYCDFYSMRVDAERMDTYTKALEETLAAWAARTGRAADTLYFGGGTPSLLGGKRIASLVDTARAHYGLADAEITVECNPSDADGCLFEMLACAGVNRISLGLQSALDEERKALGRRAGVKEAEECIRLAKAAGITNLSLDLMIGICLLYTSDAVLRGAAPGAAGVGGGIEEYAMLRLRLTEGLREDLLSRRYGYGIPDEMRRAAQQLAGYGLLEQDKGGIRLTRKGFLLSNAVIAELLYDADAAD